MRIKSTDRAEFYVEKVEDVQLIFGCVPVFTLRPEPMSNFLGFGVLYF
jgi:hypothetical protein